MHTLHMMIQIQQKKYTNKIRIAICIAIFFH